jgi:hypothetical protein
MIINKIEDLIQYVSKITEEYDPRTWSKRTWKKEDYDKQFAIHLLYELKSKYDFSWGNEMPNISPHDWVAIAKFLSVPENYIWNKLGV